MSFDITLQTTAMLVADPEPDAYISEYVGLIRRYRERDNSMVRVGKFRAYRIHAELAADHGLSLFEVCDAHSDEMHRLHAAVYEPDDFNFKTQLLRGCDTPFADCLVLDYVVLHPKWRGLKVGLLAVRKMLDLLGAGCSLAVCDIAPLNENAPRMLGIPPSWVPPVKDDAAVKLRRYFRRMGFRRVGRTSYYALPLMRQSPTARDLLRPQE